MTTAMQHESRAEPFDMAVIAAELADALSMVEAYRAHEYATRIIRELEMAHVRLGMFPAGLGG